jgi:hypothetical protein
VPSPWSTHAILYAKVDGKDRWIDTTAPYSRWDYLPRSDRDRVCYIVDEKTTRLARTPAMTASDNKIVATTRMKIDADGTSHNERVIEYSGEAALVKRERWADASTKERRRLVRTELLDTQIGAKLDKLEFDEQALRQGRDPLTATLTFSVPDQFAGDGDLDGSIAENSLWGYLLGVNVDPERELPLELKEPFETITRYEIEAPKGFLLEDPPEDADVKSKWGQFTLKVTEEKKGRRWIVEFHTRLDRTRVTKAELDEFELFQDAVQASIHVPLTLREIKDN